MRLEREFKTFLHCCRSSILSLGFEGFLFLARGASEATKATAVQWRQTSLKFSSKKLNWKEGRGEVEKKEIVQQMDLWKAAF